MALETEPARDFSVEASAFSRRYDDAYQVARVITSVGKIIKAIGIVVAILILVGGGVASGSNESLSFILWFISILFGAIVGLSFYFLGIVISAQGQILRATLDSSVNTCPFLSNSDRASIVFPSIGGNVDTESAQSRGVAAPRTTPARCDMCGSMEIEAVEDRGDVVTWQCDKCHQRWKVTRGT